MTVYIALLRGINVGGHNVLPMKALREILVGLGLAEVKTYIQSGNCVFETEITDRDALAERIAGQIETSFLFRPSVLILTKEELRAALSGNPFAAIVDDPKSVNLFFLKSPAQCPDLEGLEAARKAGETFQLIGQVFYLYTPNGFHNSKIGARAEQFLGVSATARNLRSATKIMELASSN